MEEISLFDELLEEPQKPSGPVICLGMTFENDEARRSYFIEELRKKLRDPEFRKIEGFPFGRDEDILNLSDPPYYCACPNPWISDFIAEWEAQKPNHPEGYQYHREPFATDVREGKKDPIYNAHPYHTKVPHKAIMRYILHYTDPGDIVFDGFCGTGMTGVAAQMCGNREVVMSLGYQVNPDGTILQEEIGEDGKIVWRPFSKLGVRKVILNDLSTAATFIAYNYNTPVEMKQFVKEVKSILNDIEKECSWMYQTTHHEVKKNIDKTVKKKGKINYTVWSDVFVCPECSREIIFWNVAVDKVSGEVYKTFNCPYCSAILTKRSMERAWITKYDNCIKQSINQAKQVPVLINYSVYDEESGKYNRFEKIPDEADINLLKKIENMEIPYLFPTNELPEGFNTQQPKRSHGLTNVHHFYFKRGLWVLACAYHKTLKLQENIKRYILFTIQQAVQGLAKISRYVPTHFSQVNQYLNGTLYIGSQVVDVSLPYIINGKIKRLSNILNNISFCSNKVITTQDSSSFKIPSNSLDYIFIDPPFGANINYSELNFLWESWLKIWTNSKHEAIENSVQGKGINEYRKLMTLCFQEAYRIIKPGRWITIEFSNTKASVWNSIQTALTEAGFIVANVSALDKKQGSFKAVTTPTAVKQDLVISAYKPNGGFEERFQKEAQTEDGVWDFVRTHLKYLPVTKQQGGLLQFVPERDPRILFDQMVAYYIRTGYPVPLSSQEFQIGLSQRFIERDGMFFLPEQVAEYDRKKMTSGEPKQMSFFVSDEASAIQWLRQLIKEKTQTFSEINPQFMQQLGGWNKNEARLDLRELLNQNFLCYDGKGPVPEQIHAYLSTNWKDLRNLPKDDPVLVAKACDRWYVPDPRKAGDLEKLREKALLKEFEEYKEAKKKLKIFRLEAVRAGFKKAWLEHDYAVIIAVAEKIPTDVIEGDNKLLMWHDLAVTRMGGNS